MALFFFGEGEVADEPGTGGLGGAVGRGPCADASFRPKPELAADGCAVCAAGAGTVESARTSGGCAIFLEKAWSAADGCAEGPLEWFGGVFTPNLPGTNEGCALANLARAGGAVIASAGAAVAPDGWADDAPARSIDDAATTSEFEPAAGASGAGMSAFDADFEESPSLACAGVAECASKRAG